MLSRLFKASFLGLFFIVASLQVAQAAPYAAVVMDARSGEILHSRNADTRLHPASLTKMMTLYVVFEAVRRGELSLDTRIKISRKAAAEQPSKLGLKSGQRIELRYLIRAAAVKSANDAATALGEAVAGSEAAFARRMNRTAKALGMTRTTFKNAHGLTEAGHLSTARDMSLLGRHLLYDYPQYYNLFSRRSTNAGVRNVANTNRRFLANYRGADGIKTGYTRAAGFNLVASAERGSERIIATMFGGTSTPQRNARVAELLDMGFKRAPSRTKFNQPERPSYTPAEPAQVAKAPVVMTRSPRPDARPTAVESPVGDDILLAALETPEVVPEEIPKVVPVIAATTPSAAPKQRPDTLAIVKDSEAKPAPEIQVRATTSGSQHWAISLGKYTTRNRAERFLLQTALQEIETLDEALRKVVDRPQGWEANFVGLSQSRANMACQRLSARGVDCEVRGPST